MTGRFLAIGIVSIGLMQATVAAAADAPRVIVSIKPVHSLVAAVMQAAGEPTLLLGSGASPHTYSLKPSDARALQQAQLVFWVGEGLETFLEKPLATLPQSARVIELADAEGVTLLPYRASGPWEAHVHGGAQSDPNAHGHEHGHGHGHGREQADMHIWLDADNARAIVRAASAALGAADPARARLYRANAEQADARIAALDATLRAELTPLAGRPYVVFHDAYQYLEHRYGLTPVGSITVNPDRQPSAQRVSSIREKIVANRAVCVFSEPQFQPALVTTLIEGTGARTGVLDADGGIGAPAGADAYFTIMRTLGSALSGCLKPAS
jgi:zinc transport system substrate-binding protein